MTAAPREDVLAAVSYDEARTVSEIASAAFGRHAWDYRQTTRLRLLELEEEGLVITNEERPLRFMRPDPTIQPAPRTRTECDWPECLPCLNEPHPFCVCDARARLAPKEPTPAQRWIAANRGRLGLEEER